MHGFQTFASSASLLASKAVPDIPTWLVDYTGIKDHTIILRQAILRLPRVQHLSASDLHDDVERCNHRREYVCPSFEATSVECISTRTPSDQITFSTQQSNITFQYHRPQPQSFSTTSPSVHSQFQQWHSPNPPTLNPSAKRPPPST